MKIGLTYGEAQDATKKGQLVRREEWKEKSEVLFERPADEVPLSAIMGIKSLPQQVKELIVSGRTAEEGTAMVVKFTSYLCKLDADGTVVNQWYAPTTDRIAKDWYVVE